MRFAILAPLLLSMSGCPTTARPQVEFSLAYGPDWGIDTFQISVEGATRSVVSENSGTRVTRLFVSFPSGTAGREQAVTLYGVARGDIVAQGEARVVPGSGEAVVIVLQALCRETSECNRPPSLVCNGEFRRVFSSSGDCVDSAGLDACLYDYREEHCASGCMEGMCMGDASTVSYGLTERLYPPGEVLTAAAGDSVAISADGMRLAIGAPEDVGTASVANGRVHLYRWNGSWMPEHRIDGVSAFGEFGKSVALSADGTWLAVGEPFHSAGQEHGRVHVYRHSGGNWSLAQTLSGKDVAVDAFGSAIALSSDGNQLVVGAPGDRSTQTRINSDGMDVSAPGVGAVYVFRREGERFAMAAYLKASNATREARFGTAVATDNVGHVVVGAPGDAEIDGIRDATFGHGSVFVYAQQDGVWRETQRVLQARPSVSAEFGRAVAISADGSTLVAGAPGEENAEIFRLQSTYLPFQTVTGPGAVSVFGSAVAVDANGTNLFVGAPAISSSITQRHGDVYAYYATADDYRPAGILPRSAAAVGAFGFWSGKAVACASDGRRVVVGAPQADVEPRNAMSRVTGAVFTYERMP